MIRKYTSIIAVGAIPVNIGKRAEKERPGWGAPGDGFDSAFIPARCFFRRKPKSIDRGPTGGTAQLPQA